MLMFNRLMKNDSEPNEEYILNLLKLGDNAGIIPLRSYDGHAPSAVRVKSFKDGYCDAKQIKGIKLAVVEKMKEYVEMSEKYSSRS